MSDNTVLNAGTGGDQIRDIDRGSGVKTQVVQLDLGGAGSTEHLISAGQQTMANSVPVVLSSDGVVGQASDSAATTDTGTFSVVALIKRALQNWTSLLSKWTTTATTDSSRMPVDLRDGLSASGSLTSSRTSTVTISQASPAVVNWPSHGLSVGDSVVLTTAGTLPSPLIAGNTVYVQSVVDSNNFNIAFTKGGSAIATTSAGSGGHTGTANVLFMIDLAGGYESVGLRVTSAGSTSTISYEWSEDQTTWDNALGWNPGSGTNATVGTSTTAIPLVFPRRLRYFRARVSTAGTGPWTIVGSASRAGFLADIHSGVNLGINGQNSHGGTPTGNPVMVSGRAKDALNYPLGVSDGSICYVLTDLFGYMKVTLEFTYFAISATTAGTAIKGNKGMLHAVNVTNGGAAGSLLSLYDNPSAATTPIAIIDCSAARSFQFNTWFANGLFAVVTSSGTAPNITISYR